MEVGAKKPTPQSPSLGCLFCFSIGDVRIDMRTCFYFSVGFGVTSSGAGCPKELLSGGICRWEVCEQKDKQSKKKWSKQSPENNWNMSLSDSSQIREGLGSSQLNNVSPLKSLAWRKTNSTKQHTRQKEKEQRPIPNIWTPTPNLFPYYHLSCSSLVTSKFLIFLKAPNCFCFRPKTRLNNSDIPSGSKNLRNLFPCTTSKGFLSIAWTLLRAKKTKH